MTFINWDVTTRFDPNVSLQSSTSGQHGIPLPSYGNYGGSNYSAGVEGGRTPEPADLTPATLPKDPLDLQFYQHDLVYQHVKDGLVPTQNIPNVIAQAGVTLAEGMLALTQTHLEPEALLYDAFATIGIVAKILGTPTELAYLQTLPISDQVAVITAAQAAISNFETGLAETPGAEARSLNGAFHVFEAHFADLLPSATQTATALDHWFVL
jgi:hypothetical protein